MKFDDPTDDHPSSPCEDEREGFSDNQDSSPAGRSQWKEIKELIFNADSTPFRRVKQMVELDPSPKKTGYLKRRRERKFKPRFISLAKKRNLIERNHIGCVQKVHFGFEPSLLKYSENITKLVKYGIFSTVLQKIEEINASKQGSPLKTFNRTFSKIGADTSDIGKNPSFGLRNSLHEIKLKVNNIDNPKMVRLASLRKNRNYQNRMKLKHKHSQKQSDNSLLKLFTTDKLSEESISIGSETDMSDDKLPKIQVFEVDNPLKIKQNSLDEDSYVSKRKISLNIQALENSPFLHSSANEVSYPCYEIEGKKQNFDTNFLNVDMLRPPSTMATTHMDSVTMKKSSEKPLTVNSDFEAPKEISFSVPSACPILKFPGERLRRKIVRPKVTKKLSKHHRRTLSTRLKERKRKNLTRIYSPKPTQREILRIRNFRSL
ncbi:unnamed protein product [Moneuplotes crassus]|uniref:Uncharacterized protein n=1 Tax=Euplotes crassus TaxID=5936 RepID=A0AAD1UBU6_EUPCR|nr:unnamed protein product [Moneuplotes crassus]